MSVPLIQSPQSIRDVENIVRWFIEQKSPEVGVRFAHAIGETLEFLTMFPEIGSPYESSKPRHQGTRFELVRGFPNHLIFYRMTVQGLLVLRVLHGHQDIENVL